MLSEQNLWTALKCIILYFIWLFFRITQISVWFNPLGTKGFQQNGDLAVYGASPGDPRRLVSVSVT